VIEAFGYNGDLSNLSESEFQDVQEEMHTMEVKAASPATETPEHLANIDFKPDSKGYKGYNGRTYTFGLAETGDGPEDPEFYTLLQDPNRAGIPASQFDRNIWASLSRSEGSLRAINTWDGAFLSVGPFQHTVGTEGDKGELPGILATVRSNAPEAYWRHFGRFGLKPTGIEGGRVPTAHFELHGEVLDTPEKKKKLRRFKWAHRFREAMRDPDIQEWVLRAGFERLDAVRDCSFETKLAGWNESHEVRLGDVFRRDLGQALMLDAHINYPILVWRTNSNIWIDKAESLLSEENAKPDELGLSKRHERELVISVLEERKESGMTDGSIRSRKILDYVEEEEIRALASVHADLSSSDESSGTSSASSSTGNSEGSSSGSSNGSSETSHVNEEVKTFLSEVVGINVGSREVPCSEQRSDEQTNPSEWCEIKDYHTKTLSMRTEQ